MLRRDRIEYVCLLNWVRLSRNSVRFSPYTLECFRVLLLKTPSFGNLSHSLYRKKALDEPQAYGAWGRLGFHGSTTLATAQSLLARLGTESKYLNPSLESPISHTIVGCLNLESRTPKAGFREARPKPPHQPSKPTSVTTFCFSIHLVLSPCLNLRMFTLSHLYNSSQ